MGLTGALKQVSIKICPHCNKEYGKHSKKGFMKCLYTANFNLYNVVIELNELKSKQPLELPQKIVTDDVKNVEITYKPDNWTRDLKDNQSIATDNCGGKDDDK